MKGNPMTQKTQINRDLPQQIRSKGRSSGSSENRTGSINEPPQIPAGQNSTSINTELKDQLEDLSGRLILDDSFRILHRLVTPAESGEADLFVAKSSDPADQNEYIAKIYRRSETFSDRKTEILKNLDSPYVSRIVAAGTFRGRQVLVLPYYRRGSLDGKTVRDMIELKKIIRQLNEGLKALHDQGIIHKDIKPANIMIKDDGDLAIIDFGISSVLDSNATVSKTKLGLTPQYSALETLVGGNFIRESDYYSFGIVLYVLFTGHTPYQSDDEAENSSFQLLQHLPFPSDMPQELVDLIKGLTYKDITNRHDLSNPNRRWTYREVCSWLEGKPAVVPGYAADSSGKPVELFEGSTYFPMPYRFNNENYRDSLSLASALARNWNTGIKHLFRGLLTEFCRSNGLSDLAIVCSDAEEEYRQNRDQNLVYFNFLYRFDPNLTDLAWREYTFINLSDLGDSYLENLFTGEDSMGDAVTEMVSRKILSKYVTLVAPEEHEVLQIISSLEQQLQTAGDNMLSIKAFKYTLAYSFATRKYFKFHGHTFMNYEETSRYFYDLINRSYTDYQTQREEFLNVSNNIILHLWLKAIE